MSGRGSSYQGNEDSCAGEYIGTQPVQSQYPGVLFDPSLLRMQSNGANFLQTIPPYSFAHQVHEFATPSNPRAVGTNRSIPLAGQHAGPFVQHKQDALVLNEGLGMNMSYTQMLLAADFEAAFFGSPHTDRYPVGAENETFMVTGRNSSLNEQNDMDIPMSSTFFEDNVTANWDNNWTDSWEAGPCLQALTWKDGVPAPGADLLQALGMRAEDNDMEDDARSEDSDADPTAFVNVLAVTEEDPDQVVAEYGVEQNNNANVGDDGEELTQEDIDNFLEDDGVVAAQTCSQEVRSQHVPQMGMDFDSSNAAQWCYGG